jgi:hypothetical protein
MGYIFLDVHEQHHEAPISGYFTSAGHKVVRFPCPDFAAFLRANYLRTQDVSFVGDLCNFIIPMGRQIIQDTTSSDDVGVNLSWLPKPPDKDWHSASSYSSRASFGVQRPCPHRATNHPDLDGIDPPPAFSPPHPPSSFTMGGALNCSHFSPLTLSSGLGMRGHVGMGVMPTATTLARWVGPLTLLAPPAPSSPQSSIWWSQLHQTCLC